MGKRAEALAPSADRGGKEVWVNLANVNNIWRDLDAGKIGSDKTFSPLLGGQKTGIRTEFRFDCHARETIEQLED